MQHISFQTLSVHNFDFLTHTLSHTLSHTRQQLFADGMERRVGMFTVCWTRKLQTVELKAQEVSQSRVYLFDQSNLLCFCFIYQ